MKIRFRVPAVLFGLFLLVGAALARTDVSGNITGNVTWTTANSPYYATGDLTVRTNAVLTIQAGVIVKFTSGRTMTLAPSSGPTPGGKVVSQGTSGNPVVFTSYRDDSYGGDDNADGVSTGTAGDWANIDIRNSSNNLENCLIRFGGSSIASVRVYQCNPTIRNNTIEYSAENGLSAYQMTGGVISNNTIRYSGNNLGDHGVYLDESSPTIANNTIQNSYEAGLWVEDRSTPTISGNTITASGTYPIVFHGSPVSNVSGNNFAGNTYSAFQFDGTMQTNTTLSNIQSLNWPYVVESTLTINSGVAVTVPAGQVIKGKGAAVVVEGLLTLQGTAGTPVVFTSYRDDSYGGDSNGDGSSSGSLGDWGYIEIRNRSNTVANCLIRYGGSSYGAIRVYQCNPTIRNNTIEYSAENGLSAYQMTGGVISNNTIRFSGNNLGDHGIYLDESSPQISSNTIQNSIDSGICVEDRSSPTISGNTITTSGTYPIMFRGSPVSTLSGNNLTGNAYNAFRFDGTIQTNTTLSNLQGLNWPYVVESTLTINSGVGVTVPASQVIKGKGAAVVVEGLLTLQGTTSNPVVFTSYRDDSFGGDSNGDGSTSGSLGDWGYIEIRNGSNTVANCLIRFGGSSYGAIRVYQCNPAIRSNTIEYSAENGLSAYQMTSGTIQSNQIRNCGNNPGDHGIHLDQSSPWVIGNDVRSCQDAALSVYSSSPQVTGNVFTANSKGVVISQAGSMPVLNYNDITGNLAGLTNSSGNIINAEYNWWGNANGPSGVGPGTGDSVSSNVDFTPWLGMPNSLPTYLVTYDANGATGGSIPASQTKTNGLALTLRTNSGSLVKAGFTFAGWNTASSGSGTNYAAGGSYTLDAPVTLYAKWTAAATYAVTYDANGATGGSIPASQTKTNGLALTLRTNSGSLVKAGFTFAGWNTASSGSGTNYAAGGSYTLDAPVTLYAKWTAAATYAVTYNANGATGGSIPASQTKTNGLALTLRTNSGSLVKAGFTFVGWNTTSSGSGTNYAAGGSYTLDAPVTLYAKWTAAATYAVTYNANGATSGSIPASQTKTNGLALTLRTNSGNLSKTGFTFVGWNTASNALGTDFAAGGSYTLDAPVTLYAKWTSLNNSYAVCDYNNDGQTDMAVFEIDGGRWYIRTLGGGVLGWSDQWGWSTAWPVVGDYNGDGVWDQAVFDTVGGFWYIKTLTGSVIRWADQWGWSTAKPVPGDYNGDTIWDQAVFDTQGGYWYIKTVGGAVIHWADQWGWSTAKPVPGDYNGDGIWDQAVFDTQGGYWYIKTVGGAVIRWADQWGWSTAKPVPGDYNGDGQFDQAVFDTQGGYWYIKTVNGAVITWAMQWGWSTAKPVSGDFDGDGIYDLAVYDTAKDLWYIMSLDGRVLAWGVQWGFYNCRRPTLGD